MSNGSILVVGGDETESGNPQPNLEILPRIPGGDTTVYLDFLAQTWPFNLYPFLFVLPSGNIFISKFDLLLFYFTWPTNRNSKRKIVYYNEARILDKTTFNTVKQMPKVPASLNNFDGGRTYPFSGAAMILPQRTPYTDPMTIIVCGGATQERVGLDTCVSISPETNNPQWTVKQMVSSFFFLQ
jgi:hypothetical protein